MVQRVECRAWGNAPEGASPAQTLRPAWQRAQCPVLPPGFCLTRKIHSLCPRDEQTSVTAPCASCLDQLCVARRGVRLCLSGLLEGPRDRELTSTASHPLLTPPATAVPRAAEAPVGGGQAGGCRPAPSLGGLSRHRHQPPICRLPLHSSPAVSIVKPRDIMRTAIPDFQESPRWNLGKRSACVRLVFCVCPC